MVKVYLSFILFLITTPAAADFTMSIENFEQFKKVEINQAEDLSQNRALNTQQQREESKTYVYPEYYYSHDAENSYQWLSDGYTVLKDEPSGDHEVTKLQRIQRDLKEAMGSDFESKFQALDDTYSLIDVRYYAISTNSEEACISVRWKAYLNDTVNFCGYHRVSEEGVSFEIKEWSLNAGGWNYNFFKQEDAWQLLEFAQAALSVVYNIPENQRALLKALNTTQYSID